MKRARRLLLDDEDEGESQRGPDPPNVSMHIKEVDTLTARTVFLGLYNPDTVTSRAVALQFKRIPQLQHEARLRGRETKDIDLESMEQN